MKQYVMGNGAIALGALSSGIGLIAGYPGTPSSEIIETVSKAEHDGVHVEWSVNEKAAMEVAAAASYSGARCMVTMKQVGLNVASDPLMSLAYVGVKGGMIVVSADDPGPISSQTEQDSRRFAEFARVPVFDPSSPEEAFDMVGAAYELSEKYHTPVFLRPTTRICHAYASIDVPEEYHKKEYEGFVKDSKKWVIFPRLSFENHAMIEKRNAVISREFSDTPFNTCEGASSKAVVTGGVSYAYAKEFLKDDPDIKIIKVGTPFPFPDDFVLKALEGTDEVICFEELSPFLEENILRLAGKHHLDIKVSGKLDGLVPSSGELSANAAEKILGAFFDIAPESTEEAKDVLPLPVRPPVLCAGCPHRASFYAVKQAMKGKKAVFCGDIGCYTLGNAAPLDMVDTCLCMGAGVNITQGIGRIEPDTNCFAFVGDSTFFASAITGVINAVYNQADMTLVVLDNSTTAMTGHQPHPGTGRTMMGQVVDKVSIEAVLRGIGVKTVETVDPLKLDAAVDCVKRVSAEKGVKAIIFKSPCAVLIKGKAPAVIDSGKCINCKKCINSLGCPGLVIKDGKAAIEASLCTGCGLCSQVCPVNAIGGGENAE